MSQKPPGTGNSPITRTNILNVQDYGARGDNSTNDTAAIGLAITAASVAGGGTVYFPPGTYRISTALSVPNFVNLEGAGQSSIIRCTGNHYAINFNPANRVRVSGLQIDALSVQASGGGFDFTNARFNIRIDDVYMGSNLFTSFNIKPNATSGHFYISRVKWNGVASCTNGLLIGDGTNLVAHVILRELLGTLTASSDMADWMIIKNNVDTLKCENVEFYTGTRGIIVGEVAANTVTDVFFHKCLIDFMTATGVNVSKCRGFNWTDGQIQTCSVGMNVGTTSTGVKVKGGTIQNCTDDGVTVQSGAAHWSFEDVAISDNNTSNGAFGQGFDITGGTSNWSIKNCRIGNNILLTTGHQKNGILISAGASDNFEISGNRFSGNETAPMDIASATGGKKIVRNNPGENILSVVAAATVTLPGTEVVTITGNTNITAITAGQAGQRVTLLFSGTPTVTDGSNLKLAGNFVAAGTTADVDSLTLASDGTNWIEVARSTN